MKAFAVFLSIGLLVVCSSYAQEPVYRGITLSRWKEHARDKRWEVREEVASALGEMGPEAEAAIPALVELLKDENDFVILAARDALTQIGTAAMPVLTELLRDRSADVRWGAARALGGMGPEAKAAIPALSSLLQDPSTSVRTAAASALRNMGPEAKSAMPTLMKLLKDEDAGVRSGAAEALVKMGPEGQSAGIPVMTETLRANVRSGSRAMSVSAAESTANALAGLGPEGKTAAVSALLELLKDKDKSVRKNAVWTVGDMEEMGPEADAAIPVLVDLLQDEHDLTRYTAVGYFGKITEKIGIISDCSFPARLTLTDSVGDGVVCYEGVVK